jgi:hypothetical protein
MVSCHQRVDQGECVSFAGASRDQGEYVSFAEQAEIRESVFLLQAAANLFNSSIITAFWKIKIIIKF